MRSSKLSSETSKTKYSGSTDGSESNIGMSQCTSSSSSSTHPSNLKSPNLLGSTGIGNTNLKLTGTKNNSNSNRTPSTAGNNNGNQGSSNNNNSIINSNAGNTMNTSNNVHTVNTSPYSQNTHSNSNQSGPTNNSNQSTNSNNTRPSINSQQNTSYSRRLWIRMIEGTPTTLTINRNDIIDDVKSMVISKYPNSLGRFYDPADLFIKMDLSARSPNNVNNSNNSKRKNTVRSPEQSAFAKSPISPMIKQSSVSHHNFSDPGYSYVNLEPDQNVWSIIDHYYPTGMSMPEAFIISLPMDHISNINQHQGSISQPQTNSKTTGYEDLHMADPRRDSNDGRQGSQFYQPKPENVYLNRTLAHNLHIGSFNQSEMHKERSISPSTTMNTSSPLHRRAHSNPPMSPFNSSPQGSVSGINYNSLYNGNGNYQKNFKNFNNNSEENNQPILLLPKNFSLASNNNEVVNDKKKIILDDRIRHFDNTIKNGNNITSIGVGNQPAPFEEDKYLNKTDEVVKKDKRDLNEDNESLVGPKGPSVFITPSSSSSSSSSAVKTNRSEPNDKLQISSSVNENSNSNESTESKKSKSDRKTEAVGIRAQPNLTTDQVLPSISVLVVEDNAINQAILGAFLRKHKIHYKIAKNGQEAIDKWRKGGFHLVLMDIQLPVKSGIEVTKEIRHLEKINKIGVFTKQELNINSNENVELKEDENLDLDVFRSPVIIVALTASSNSSTDKKSALMAGCNDYLTKPVNLVWLQNKITEWGCMQALIDFDGWQRKGSFQEIPKVSSSLNSKNAKNVNNTSVLNTKKYKPSYVTP